MNATVRFVYILKRCHLLILLQHEIVTTPEYVTFTDEIYQRQTEKRLLPIAMASMANKRTIVMPILQDSFLTLDYTNNTERLVANKGHHKYLYKDKEGAFLPEIYFWMQDDVYHDEVMGMQLNQQGTVLAVWTSANTVYIYQRGRVDRTVHDPHQVDRKLEWILKKKISPLEGRIGIYVVSFWFCFALYTHYKISLLEMPCFGMMMLIICVSEMRDKFSLFSYNFFFSNYIEKWSCKYIFDGHRHGTKGN